MEYLSEKSKPGYYNVYLHENEKEYYVLAGLDADQIHERSGIEAFIHQHYQTFEVFYWLLLLATMTYVVGTYIVIPLLQQYRSRA